MSDLRGVTSEPGVVANAWLVTRREFVERVRSRLFIVSTGLLASLAVVVAMTPVLIKAVDRDTTTTIAVISDDVALREATIATIDSVLNPPTPPGQPLPYTLVGFDSSEPVLDRLDDGNYDGALLVTREANGRISFQMLSSERLGTDRVQLIQVGALAVGIYDFAAHNVGGSAAPLLLPAFQSAQVGASGSTGGQPIGAAEYAGRRIVGVVFVVLIFIMLVIYGMWVAAGVVAEKSSRVMELLISAASSTQLVVGKVAGNGLAGFVQYVAILVPALVTLLLQERIAVAVLGSSSGLDLSLAALSPGLLLAYGAFWVLGFILYALIYAAAGSLVSRAEDLQILALPLSLVAIGGYFLAVMALSGGISPLIRLASYVPFWSPFVMLTRLTVGRVEPWELVLAFGLLIATIPIVAVIAVRVYSAGVLLYGQRPGARAIIGAIVRPPA